MNSQCSLFLHVSPFLYSPYISMLSFSYLYFIFWSRIRLCLVIYRTLGSSMFLLLFFEPVSIAFETLQVKLLDPVRYQYLSNQKILWDMSTQVDLIVWFGKYALQAILVHGFQLLDIWLHHSAVSNTNCQRFKLFDTSAAGYF